MNVKLLSSPSLLQQTSTFSTSQPREHVLQEQDMLTSQRHQPESLALLYALGLLADGELEDLNE